MNGTHPALIRDERIGLRDGLKNGIHNENSSWQHRLFCTPHRSSRFQRGNESRRLLVSNASEASSTLCFRGVALRFPVILTFFATVCS